jgi:hypothetical protein
MRKREGGMQEVYLAQVTMRSDFEKKAVIVEFKIREQGRKGE